jgi:hypothetical protein
MTAEMLQQPSIEVTQPGPNLAENLALVAQQTGRLEAELPSLAGTNTYPEWWTQEAVSLSVVRQQLRDPNADPKYVSEYFQLYKNQLEVRAAISGHDYGISPLASAYHDLGAEVVARGLLAEAPTGPMHTAIAESLQRASVKKYEHIASELGVLRQAYGKGSLTGLLGLSGDEYVDTLRPLLRSEGTIRSMRHAEQERGNDDTWRETQTKARKWMGRALSSATGVDEAEAAEYVFAASRRGEDKSIAEILDRFDHFGVDRLRKLSGFTGIHAFETYSTEQLTLMEDLMQNPQEVAERLANHDVTVVMVNRVGDHNGVMGNAAENFEDGRGRTLFFEINSMGDIYRHMLQLQKLGIKPSSLVLAAHSAPGQFMVSDDREPAMKRRDMATIAGRALVEFVNKNGKLDPGEYAYSMHGMKGMARLVEDLMQPSRAIDDAEEDAGRKKILFQACDAASEDESVDINESGSKFVVGMDSVVSRLGRDLAANGVRSSIDIYGASAGIQLHKTKRGVRYSGQPAAFGEERQQQQAVRIRVEGGKVMHQHVDEIVMHKD